MKYARWAAALIVSGAGLWFALHGVKWSQVIYAVAHLKKPGWLLICLAIVGVVFLGRSLRWKLILSPLLPAARVVDFFPITAGGFFLNNVLPFRAGEVARVFWTHQRMGVPVGSLVSVLAVERLFDIRRRRG